MRIGSSFGNVSTFGSSASGPSSTLSHSANGAPADRSDLLAARRQLIRVVEAFDAVDRLVNGRSTIVTTLPSARSNPALMLNLTETATAMSSAQEVNATPTSFSPFSPAWTNPSLAQLTIGGIYDGSDGSGVLTFQSRDNGVHGEDRLRIRVRDTNDKVIANINIRSNHDPDRQYDIGNGLFLTLGPGSLEKNVFTQIDVFDNVGSAVDPDKPLAGTGNDNPNLQYGLAGVVDGSFQINGETINVDADGSLNDVIDAINQSGAGVTAVFNAASERIELTQNTLGSASDIVISGDNSNFVAATKLDTAVATPGTDKESRQPMAGVAQFASVQSGNFVINDTNIAIDAANDSLDDVIARINASDANATASFDEQTQRVVVRANESDESLTIDGNGTGIFDALNMPEGRLDPRARGSGYSRRQAGAIVRAMENSIIEVNKFFAQTGELAGSDGQIAGLRKQFESAFAGILGTSDGRVDTGFGLRFNFDGVASSIQQFATLDTGDMTRRLHSRGAAVKQFLNGSSQNPGFLQAASSAALGAVTSLNTSLGVTGSLLDLYV